MDRGPRRNTFTDDFIEQGDRVRRQHPELMRHPSLKPGQHRYDPEFGRKNNPAAWAEEHGGKATPVNPSPPPRGDTGGVRGGRR